MRKLVWRALARFRFGLRSSVRGVGVGLGAFGLILLLSGCAPEVSPPTPSAPSVSAPKESASKESEVSIPVGEGRGLKGTLFAPEKVPAPGVLVLHTRGGLTAADSQYARELAREGFVSLVVSYLNPKWPLQHPGYIRDLSMVVDYLQARPEVQGRPVGVVGFSLGSKGVQVSARHRGVRAVVSYYGVYDLRILPQARHLRSYPSMPVDVAAQVQAPVLLLHGEWDDETPLNQAESMRDALKKAGKVHELVVYPRAYHSFDRGWQGRRPDGKGPEGYTYIRDEKARVDAWKQTLAWFRKYLTAAP